MTLTLGACGSAWPRIQSRFHVPEKSRPGTPENVPHEIIAICGERFARLETEVIELKRFRENHDATCREWKDDIHREITELKVTVARYAVIAVILGCIGAAVVASVVDGVLAR